MTCRVLGRLTGMMALSLSLIGGPAIAAADELAAPSAPLKLIVDTSDSEALMMAVGLSSLAKLKVDKFDIETIWTNADLSLPEATKGDDRFLQLLGHDRMDEIRLDARSERRAVMSLWRTEEAQDQASQDPDSGHLLVASAAVSPASVEVLIKAIQANQSILKAANIDVAKLDPSISMASRRIAQHQGTLDYLGVDEPVQSKEPQLEIAIGEAEPAVEPQISRARTNLVRPAAKLDGRSFTVYFEHNEAKLDRNDMTSVAEACRYAATLPKARFVIAGYTDTVGPSTYNERLSRKRAESAANAIKNDPRFREVLSVVEFGEDALAVNTDDETPEPMNRRVEITVVQDE